MVTRGKSEPEDIYKCMEITEILGVFHKDYTKYQTYQKLRNQNVSKRTLQRKNCNSSFCYKPSFLLLYKSNTINTQHFDY